MKSLPVSKEDLSLDSGIKADKQALDVELVNDAARWLKQRLGLTIFGFDVVVSDNSPSHLHFPIQDDGIYYYLIIKANAL